MNFGKLLSGIMHEQELTQQALSKSLGIRQSQVSNWLNGKSLPGYYSIRLLSKTLNVSADFLLELK